MVEVEVDDAEAHGVKWPLYGTKKEMIGVCASFLSKLKAEKLAPACADELQAFLEVHAAP